MNDKEFKKIDEIMMKKTESLRSQRVSEGMMKGFSASVERRISGGAEVVERKTAGGLLWVPTLAVMVLASVAVLRTPVHEIQLAQAVAPADEVQDDITVLSELGVLDEVEDADLLGTEDVFPDENTELTRNVTLSSAIG